MVVETTQTESVATGFDGEGYPVDKDKKRLPNSQPVLKENQQKYMDDQAKRLASFMNTSGAEGFVRDPSAATGASDPDAARRQRKNLWEVVQNRIPAGTDVPGFAKNLLSDLSCVQNSNGMLTVFNNGGDNAIFDITRGGTVGLRKNWDLNNTAQLTSADHIDALLKGAAAAVMTSGAAGANIASPNDNSQAMMEKAAQLAGLKVTNPKFLKYGPDGKPDSTALDAKLESIEKGLSTKMNDQSLAIRKKYGVEEYQVQPTIQPKNMIPDPPKKAIEITNENGATATKPNIPTVMLIYDSKNPGSSLAELDRLAAMGGDRVNVVKMDVSLLKGGDPNDPNVAAANKAAVPGLYVTGADGKQQLGSVTTVPATAEDMKKWLDAGPLKDAKIFTDAAPAAASTATAKLTIAEVGKAAEGRAATAFTGLNLKDQGAVTSKLEEAANSWGQRTGATAADQQAVSAYLGKLQSDPPLKPEQLTQATNDFLTTLSQGKDFKAPAKGEKGADLLENLSLAGQAFASANGVTNVDAKLYHTFQPNDPTKLEQLPDAVKTTASANPVPGREYTAAPI